MRADETGSGDTARPSLTVSQQWEYLVRVTSNPSRRGLVVCTGCTANMPAVAGSEDEAVASMTVPLGRKLVVRLVPYGKPAAGISVITCQGGGCAADPTRFRDPVSARTAARSHVARHIREFGPPAERATCRCGHGGCGWHPLRKVTCGGPSALVLIPDAEGRVWVIAETCTNCAEVMPRVKVLSGGRPQPNANPAPPTPTVPPPTRKAATAEAKVVERDLARNCQICAAEAPPVSQPEEAGPERPDPEKARPVPAEYGSTAVETLRYLNLVQAGHSPEARLLALLITLRLRKDGTFAMRSCDLSPLRLDLPPWALQELIDCGWADAPFEDVCAAGPGDHSVQCRVPELAGGLAHLGISPSMRSHVNAWVMTVTSHPGLA